MAFSKVAISNIDDDSDDSPTSGPSSPPPASPRPRTAADSSLYSSAGRSAMDESNSGLSAEGSNPAVIGTQGLAMVQRGLQMLNLAFPDNPGLVAVVGDLTMRLQSIIPQLVNQSANSGMGLFPQQDPMQQMAQGVPPQAGPGMAPPMGMNAPPAAGPMGPPQPMPMGMPQPPVQPMR